MRRVVAMAALVALLGPLAVGDQALLDPFAELEFEFSGCARVRPGPVCELDAERTLTLWVEGATPPEIDVANTASNRVKESLAVEGGVRVTFQVPAGKSQVRLRLGQRRASLRLAESSEPPALRELTQWWKDGKWQQVRARLDQGSDVLIGAERDRLRALRARLALRDGDNERAADELEATARSAERAGLLLEASKDRWAASYCRAIRLRQYTRASELLDGMPAELVRVPEVRAGLPYYAGLLAQARGDAQGALIRFRMSTVLARRLGMVADELQARHALADTLSQLNRDAEALAEQEALLARAPEASSCQLFSAWENLAWMLLNQPGSGLEERTAAALARAAEFLERCADPLSRRNLALNRALFALQRGALSEAEALLRGLDADETGRSGRLAAWQALYWGELHRLRAESGEAVIAYDLAERRAESLALKDCVYLARLGRARSLAQRRDAAAVGAYIGAEDAAEDFVRWTPFGQGQQLTALRMQSSARELLTLLLDLGRPPEARQAAERALRRVWAASFRAGRIATLSPGARQRWDRAVGEYRARREALERAAQDDWQLSFEGLGAIRLTRELERQRVDAALSAVYALLLSDAESASERAAARDDAQLLIAAGSDAWWAFLLRQGTLRVAPVSRFAADARAQTPTHDLAPIALGLAQVLERFQREGLLDAPLLRVSLPPDLQALDVHALRVDGRALIEWLPVGYAFELGAAPDSGAREPGSPSALVFGDPNGDLPRANAEASRVAQRLSNARLLLADQVTFDAALHELPSARLLHFAGHAHSGGIDGLEGALRLSRGQRLSVADVLVSARVPEFVVLSACTSSVSPEPGGGLSIGHAFLVAGSRAVIGASRAISDPLAGRFAEALYDQLLAAGGARALPRDIHAWAAAVRSAGLEQLRVDPRADWAALRLLLR
ncbi:MAG TPA: CHAT domain-containing protein [Polyangiaceae bacterium]|nr:CHAT domain-containing protein [Polyangiaceae bacterium]